jgi:hypothetical protein
VFQVSDQDHDPIFFSFLSINQPCCLLQCSGTTLRERLRRPHDFFIVPTCWETCFSPRRYSTYFFFYFLDHHTGHPAHHSAQILLYECIFDALWNFLIVVSIYWKSASYRSSVDLASFGKAKTGRLLSLFVLFFFWLTCMLFDLSIALWLRHDLSKVDVPTPHSGACGTWVPLGPHWPGSWSSPTSGSNLPKDPPTWQWAQPT